MGETLHNPFELFHGLLLDSKPKPYVMTHQSEGKFKSHGQKMKFDIVDLDTLKDRLGGVGLDEQTINVFVNLSPISRLVSGNSWRAIGSDRVQLGLDNNGTPDNEQPEWGITRVDLFTTGKPRYKLSLLYLIWHSEDESPPIPVPVSDGDIPLDVHSVATNLITGGRLQ